MMNKVILFDGDCNFCSNIVQFIIKRDPNFHYTFASLQSSVGQRILEMYEIPKEINSFIYVDQNKWYSKSSAALRVSRNLIGFWKGLYLFIIIPKPIRDFFYNIIARNRHKWFGKKRSCQLPSPSDRKRFL